MEVKEARGRVSLYDSEMGRLFLTAHTDLLDLACFSMPEGQYAALVDKVIREAQRIQEFVRHSTGKSREDCAELALELMRDENKSIQFIERHCAAQNC